MAKKPSYVGLLNTIANAERGGYELFKAWSDSTKDEQLKLTLDMVAVREMEHSWAFEKRLTELGFALQVKTNKALSKQVRYFKSSASDNDKFAALGVGTENTKNSDPEEIDNLLQILSDKTIDPLTGEWMGRVIAAERDSGRQLQKAFRSMLSRKQNKKSRLRKKH